jgi:tetratricopeptide (TPR) repeat protein
MNGRSRSANEQKGRSLGWFTNMFGGATPKPAAAAASAAAEWKARGNAALGQGNLAEAIRCYEQGAQADPADGALRLNLGFALLESGQAQAAEARLNQALALRRPAESFAHEAHYLLARAQSALGRAADALRSCETALAIEPAFAEAVEEGIGALRALGRTDDAAQWAARLAALRPSPAARLQSAQALLAAGQAAQAATLLESLCAEEPLHREASSLYFAALFGAARFNQALAEAQRMLAISGPDAAGLGNVAAAQGRLGRPAEALAALDEALRLEPGRQEALVNRAALLYMLGRIPEAVACAQEGLRRYPDDANLHWNLAIGQLLLGNFEEGWAEHEWRHPQNGTPRLPQPRWKGEDLRDHTMFLYGEQGFGDNIQFLRYVPEIARQARVLHLRVPPPLEPLMTQLPPNSVLVPKGSALPVTDFECSLMSLPAVLRTSEATIPRQVPYLQADPARVKAWRERLGTGRLNVGIAWAGKPTHFNDLNRSMPLATFMQAAAAGCRFVTTQPDVREADRAVLAAWPDVLDAGRELKDFADTAALVEALDLVISVDTSVAHLAGALAKPVWLLLPYVPDWRWLLDRSDSPWYPSARLYRQPAIGDWDSVLLRVKADLEAMSP